MIYLRLFLSFLQIGAFSFGGGYAALPLIRHQVVEANGWLQLSEFTDLITISQMTPGPIAVNSATFVGLKVAGIPGAVICTPEKDILSSLSPGSVFADIPVFQTHAVISLLLKTLIQFICQCHRTVLSSGTADGYYQLIFTFQHIVRHQEQ